MVGTSSIYSLVKPVSQLRMVKTSTLKKYD